MNLVGPFSLLVQLSVGHSHSFVRRVNEVETGRRSASKVTGSASSSFHFVGSLIGMGKMRIWRPIRLFGARTFTRRITPQQG